MHCILRQGGSVRLAHAPPLDVVSTVSRASMLVIKFPSPLGDKNTAKTLHSLLLNTLNTPLLPHCFAPVYVTR